MTSFKNKVVLITGSTSGIGLGLAKNFARQGADICMNGFGAPEAIEASVSEIKALGVKCFYHGADMTKPDEIQDLVLSAHREFGRLDVLVNNAGIQHVAPVEEFPESKWDAIIAINLSSAFHTIRHAVPIMRDQGGGRIINMASAHALVASPYKSAYVTAKHGIYGLTKTIALEVATDNITVNAICPGYVRTPLVEGQSADTAKARDMSEQQVVNDVLLKAQHTKKFVEIDDVAALAMFLCGDSAGNITGSAQSIDGAWVAA